MAERAGHAMHTALVQRLLRDRSSWELVHGELVHGELVHGGNSATEHRVEKAAGHLRPVTV